MSEEVSLRPVAVDDAARVAALYTAERAFLEPYEPTRQEWFFTEDGQRDNLAHAVELAAAGQAARFLILRGAAPVGLISVSGIVRGAFHSANLGYFVARAHNGQGVATRAVALAARWAFEEAELHRLQAGTLVDNIASQRVLERNGFTRIGLAPGYLHIGGEWRDHILFQRLAG